MTSGGLRVKIRQAKKVRRPHLNEKKARDGGVCCHPRDSMKLKIG
jgi:hypothetical protein